MAGKPAAPSTSRSKTLEGQAGTGPLAALCSNACGGKKGRNGVRRKTAEERGRPRVGAVKTEDEEAENSGDGRRCEQGAVETENREAKRG